jgi:drug/metabolite transporter (DMT)-like permease
MAVAFALFTSVAYGVSNYVGPRLARDAPLLVLLIAGQGCAFVLAVAIVVAQAEAAPPAGELAAALLAGVGNAGGLLLFYRAAAVGPLSIVTPIGAVGAAVPVAVGVARGEAMTALKAAGIVLALSGLVLVARRTRAGAAAAAERRPGDDVRLAVLLALGAALCFGTFLAAMGPASETSAGWAVMVSRLSLLAGAAPRRRAGRGAARAVAARRLPRLAIPGLLALRGTLSYAAATREGDLSVVSVLGSLFPVVTVALAVGPRPRAPGLGPGARSRADALRRRGAQRALSPTSC